ncbi:MAG: flagellar hook capping FlgD N-terminal domain-containing protein [Planctomycetota bacterium]|nr:flagellar hook capping FlgD N-terminal domain-containing protein [Planctomycetota bacterium]
MSSIQAAAGVQTGGAGAASGFGSMNSEEFVKIIFTELQNQDPFQPNDSAALLEQLNSIRSIESDMALTDQLKAIVFQNQLSGAGNLIGRYVQGLSTEGTRVDGKVISVIRQGDAIGVELDTGWIIEVDQVELIVDEAMFEPPSGGGNGGLGVPDMNGDGLVDGTDLTLLLSQWDEDGSGASSESGSDSDAGDDSSDEGDGDQGGSDQGDSEGSSDAGSDQDEG